MWFARVLIVDIATRPTLTRFGAFFAAVPWQRAASDPSESTEGHRGAPPRTRNGGTTAVPCARPLRLRSEG